MKLRPRLTLFTILLVVMVVAFTSITTILTLTFLLRQEMKANQITLFNNFREAVFDALYLGDDLAIQVYSESLEKSVPALAYAVFVDNTRGSIHLGGIESLERFKRFKPKCQPVGNVGKKKKIFLKDDVDETGKWRFYCQDVSYATVQGKELNGTVFLGLKMSYVEAELNAIIGRMWRILMWAMAVVLGVGLWMAFALSGRLTEPIHHLTEGAKAIGDGRLDTQIPIETTDELGFLAQEFNLMAEKLKELDKLKDDFVSSVSHELRSPLSAISGYVELLQSKPLEEISIERRTKALTIIKESTERLTHFINDILDLAKIESGTVDINRKQMKIKPLADDLVNLFQPLFEKKGIAWSVDIPSAVPDVNADGEKIRQVLTNLISNALKFTPSGGKIRIAAKNQNEFIQISVQDTGMGIPENEKEAIFERFTQVKKIKRKYYGAERHRVGIGHCKRNCRISRGKNLG